MVRVRARESFSEQLRKEVDEVDGAKVEEGLGIGALGKQRDERLAKLLESSRSEGLEFPKPIAKILLGDVPATQEELGGELVRPRRLAGGESFDRPQILASKNDSSRASSSKGSTCRTSNRGENSRFSVNPRSPEKWSWEASARAAIIVGKT